MAETPSDQSSRESRIDDAIARYLEQAERGHPPDQQEYIAQHPDLAAELQSFFSDQAQFHQLAGELAPGGATIEPELENQTPASPTPGSATPGHLSDPSPATMAWKDWSRDLHENVVRYFGDYELLEEIARGGMGVVFKARQTSLNRIVALKMILSGQLASPEDVQRFRTEAEAAAQLDHPGIVPIYEVGLHEGQHYFAMGFVDGISLAARVTAGPLPPREAAEIVCTVAVAVQYAHDHGVIHRDLKPGNVLLDKDGKPRVTDFGLAKLIESGSDLTGTGQILGTPSYMPPEQAAAQVSAVSRLSDVYSLGAILYCLLTGRPPFQAANPLETLLQVQKQEPVAPRQLNPNLPLDLETIVLKCLDKSPTRRYASAKALTEELNRYLEGRPILARPVRRIERFWRWCRREPVIASLSAAVLVASLVGTTVSAYFAAMERKRANAESKLATENGKLARDNGKLAESERDANTTAQTKSKLAEERAAKLKAALAWNYFDHGVAEYAAGRPDSSLVDLSRAVAMSSPDEPRYAGYRQVLFDRCLQGGKQLVPPLWHSGPVVDVAFSPDGGRLATISLSTPEMSGATGIVRLWDTRTGAPVGVEMKHAQMIGGIAFSPDGTRIVTCSFDKTARVWDAHTGTPVGDVMQHDAPVNSAAFSPDGTRIVTGGAWQETAEGTVRLWDAQTGTPLCAPMKQERSVRRAAFSPDGTRVLAEGGGFFRLWNAHSGAAIGVPIKHIPVVPQQFAGRSTGRGPLEGQGFFSPDGKHIVTTSRVAEVQPFDHSAQLWDANDGSPVGEPMVHGGYIWSVSFSADGTRLATASFDGTARIWDGQTGAPLSEPLKHLGAVWSAVFSPDASRLVTGSDDATARLWDGWTGVPLEEPMRHEQGVHFVAFSPEGLRIVTGSQGNIVRLWDAYTAAPVAEPLRMELTDARLNRPVSVGRSTSSIMLGGRITSSIMQREPIAFAGIALSEDGARIAVAGGDNNTARIWDAQAGVPVGEPLKNGMSISALAFSPDGTRVVTVGYGTGGPNPGRLIPSARLWDARTGTPVGKLMIHSDPITRVDFSLDGARVITLSADKTARLWDAYSGAPFGEPMKHEDEIYQVKFSPDSTRVVTVGDGHYVRLWDAHTGTPVGEPMKHPTDVSEVTFIPDGTRLVSICYADAARLWDARTGAPVGEAMRPPDNIDADIAEVSRDGTRIITRSRDGHAFWQWDAHTGAPLDEPIAEIEWKSFGNRSRDGKRIVTREAAGKLQLHSAQNGKPIGEVITDHDRRFSRFSSDSQRLLSFSDHGVRDNPHGVVQLWDANTGTSLGPPMRHDGSVQALAFTSDDTRVVSMTFNQHDGVNIVQLWDGYTGASLGEPLKYYGALQAPHFSPDGTRVTIASYFPSPQRVPIREQIRQGVVPFRVDDDRAAWLCDITMPNVDGLSLTEFQRLAELWTGIRADSDGSYRRLQSAELDEVRRHVAGRDPLQQYASIRLDNHIRNHRLHKLAYHLQAAVHADTSRRQYAAAFHLREVTRVEPEDAELQEWFSRANPLFLSQTLSRLAWVWATSPFDWARNGKLAITFGLKASERNAWRSNLSTAATLAAAYAEAGDFESAVQWQTRGIDQLLPPGFPRLPLGSQTPKIHPLVVGELKKREELIARLELYKSGKPYREPLALAPPVVKQPSPSGPSEKVPSASDIPRTPGLSEAETFFELADKDKNGEISDEEFNRSFLIRGKFNNAGITPTFPLKRDEFLKLYPQPGGK